MWKAQLFIFVVSDRTFSSDAGTGLQACSAAMLMEITGVL